MAEAKVYDIRGAECRLDGTLMTDVAPDGFSIDPAGETVTIPGLVGETGFSKDPSTAAEGSINLLSTSPENAFLRNLKQLQDEGSKGPVAFEIIVKPDFESAFGFKKKGMRFAMIQNFASFETSEKEAPSYEYTLVGYGFSEE